MYPKQLKELPPKSEPWNLIRAALADLEEQENADGVQIEMKDWHKYKEEIKLCEMCLAGCVMQSRFDIKLFETYHYSEFDHENMDKFNALSYFVFGRTRAALELLKLKWSSDFKDVDIIDYENNSTQFKQEMAGLADLLEKELANV